MNIFKRDNEKKAFRINISYLIGWTSTMLLYLKGKKMHMFGACSIFIIAQKYSPDVDLEKFMHD